MSVDLRLTGSGSKHREWKTGSKLLPSIFPSIDLFEKYFGFLSMTANLEGSGFGVKTDPDPCIEKKRVWVLFFISGYDQNSRIRISYMWTENCIVNVLFSFRTENLKKVESIFALFNGQYVCSGWYRPPSFISWLGVWCFYKQTLPSRVAESGILFWSGFVLKVWPRSRFTAG